ncbi:hypothetical protein BDN70DRAFT_20432 [Pholiota conissans]|uniref:Uncharacterized protein n=1 Tax=Pholiota conissans TaxID=109636 RepID=A0A9P6D0N8_9AGAR|nr:hypothetical protein BDN70DRAFT_20432 [Pholiota conissans]
MILRWNHTLHPIVVLTLDDLIMMKIVGFTFRAISWTPYYLGYKMPRRSGRRDCAALQRVCVTSRASAGLVTCHQFPRTPNFHRIPSLASCKLALLFLATKHQKTLRSPDPDNLIIFSHIHIASFYAFGETEALLFNIYTQHRSRFLPVRSLLCFYNESTPGGWA